MAKRLVGTKELAVILGINKDTLRRRTVASAIPRFKVGRQWRYDVEEVMKVLREISVQSRPK